MSFVSVVHVCTKGAELDLRSGSCASQAGRSGSAVPTSCSSVKPASAVSRDGKNTLPEHLHIDGKPGEKAITEAHDRVLQGRSINRRGACAGCDSSPQQPPAFGSKTLAASS